MTTTAITIIAEQATSYETMEEALAAVREVQGNWKIIGVRELNGETFTFWAAENKHETFVEQVVKRIQTEFDGWDVKVKGNNRTKMVRITVGGDDTLDIKVTDQFDYQVIRCKSLIRMPFKWIGWRDVEHWADQLCCQ